MYKSRVACTSRRWRVEGGWGRRVGGGGVEGRDVARTGKTLGGIWGDGRDHDCYN